MNSDRAVGLAVLLFLIVAVQARGDVGFPGTKRITHEVIFDNITDYPDHIFFLTPALKPDGSKNLARDGYPLRLTPGEVHSLGYAVRFRFDWVLLAVPREEVEAPGGQVRWDSPVVLRSNTFQSPDYEDTLVVSPTEARLHHFRVQMAEGELTATRTRVESVRDPVVLWTWIAVSVCLAWIGIWWVRRRRGRAGVAVRPGRDVRAPARWFPRGRTGP